MSRYYRVVLSTLALCILSPSYMPAAEAQAPRTFVSAVGNDSFPCDTPSRPCRTFNSAIAKARRGGEVVAVASGSYPPFQVNKSLTVEAAPGVYTGISVFEGAGASVTLSQTDVVVLRGLTFNGLGGFSGIHFSSGGVLQVENCVVNGFSTGIFFGGRGHLYAVDSTLRNNPGSGISIGTDSGISIATIDRCRLENNGNGINAQHNTRLTIRDSTVSGSTFSGLVTGATPTTGTTTELNIENCLITDNKAAGVAASDAAGSRSGTAIISISNSVVAQNVTGIFCGTSGTIRVSNTTVTRNITGLSVAGGLLLSRGNNTIEGNDVDGSFTGTFVAK